MIYAIGDIHGRSDLLRRAFDRIEAHAGDAPVHVVCLGDYVDRGPDSRGVVDMLMAGPRREGDRLTCLKGNHEALLIEYVAGRPRGQLSIIECGETVRTYGGEVPGAHLDWMGALPHLFETEHHLFVHAGLRPGVPLADQDADEMIWIRALFLDGDHDFGKHVVHGHTPHWLMKPEAAIVERRPYRTNLDTGACWTGELSIGVFDQARPGGPLEILSITG